MGGTKAMTRKLTLLLVALLLAGCRHRDANELQIAQALRLPESGSHPACPLPGPPIRTSLTMSARVKTVFGSVGFLFFLFWAHSSEVHRSSAEKQLGWGPRIISL